MLEQGRLWAGGDGAVQRVRDIPAAEARALTGYLRANCDLLYAVVLRREVGVRLVLLAPPAAGTAGEKGEKGEKGSQRAADTPAGGLADPVPAAGAWASMSAPARVRLWASLGRGPRVWLERTPLMRALGRQVARDAGGGGAPR